MYSHKIRLHNLRDFTADTRAAAKGGKEDLSSLTRHKTVDDRPYGGGLGMVLKVEPIFKAVEEIKRKAKSEKRKTKIILFTPRGKQFNQKTAYQLSKLNRIIMICGRYEGVDERVAKYIADMEISIGPYDLMGGELPAQVLIETVSRLIPGVLGKPELLKERITKEKGFIEYLQYTRPELFESKKGLKWRVPKVLLSGNHKKIKEWRKRRQKIIEK